MSVGDRRRLLDEIALLAIEPSKNAHSSAALPELESRQRFMEAVLDSIADPVFVKDGDHRYVYVNEAKCRLMGCKREDLIGKTDYDLPRPEKAEIEVFVERDDIVLKTGRETSVIDRVCSLFGQNRRMLAMYSSRFGTLASASTRRQQVGCSTLSTQPNLTAWAWAYRFAIRLSLPMAAGYGRRTTLGRARRFRSASLR